jgi:hypothetical protein
MSNEAFGAVVLVVQQQREDSIKVAATFAGLLARAFARPTRPAATLPPCPPSAMSKLCK